MKKNWILGAMTLCMGLFAACSQEDIPSAANEQNDRINVMAELPTEFSQVRALPSDADHQLRCILEVWSKGDAPALVYREEKLAASTDTQFAFEFNLKNGTYQSVMWADFIAKDATATDQTVGEYTYKHYTDKFYTTTDLTQVSFADGTSANLFNTDSSDAFSASQEITKTVGQLSLKASLTRPLSKLILSDKSKANFAACTEVTASYKVAKSFNAQSGNVSEETVTMTHAAAPQGSGNSDLRLFSHYIFAEANGTLGEVALTFKDYNNDVRTTAIPAGIPIRRNYRTLANGNLLAANTNMEINVSDKWTDEDYDIPGTVEPAPVEPEPAVGNFYYDDGTFGTDANPTEKNIVGIVFKTGAGKGDSKNAYGSALTEIKGYVMALKNTAKGGLYSAAALADVASFTGAIDAYDGYTNTELFKSREDYANESNFLILKALFSGFTNIEKTSGWYIPSGAQMNEIFSLNYAETNNAFKQAVALLIENGAAAAFEVTHSSNTTGYITSTVNNTAGNIYRFTLKNLESTAEARFGKASDAGFVRPVFTF